MDPVTIVVAALAAGAGAGMQDATGKLVVDVYSKLKAAVADRFHRTPAAQMALIKHARNPAEWHDQLSDHVRQVGVDEQMLSLAQLLLQAPQAAHYNVNVEKVQGCNKATETPST